MRLRLVLIMWAACLAGCTAYKEAAIRPADLPRAAPPQDQNKDRWVTGVGGEDVLLSRPVESVVVRTTDPSARELVFAKPVKVETEGSELVITGADGPRRLAPAAIDKVMIEVEDKHAEMRTAGITLLGVAGGLAVTEGILAGALWSGYSIERRGWFILLSIPIGISALGCLIPGIVLTSKGSPPRRPAAALSTGLVPELRLGPGSGTLEWTF